MSFKTDLYDKLAAVLTAHSLDITQDWSPMEYTGDRVVYTKISGESDQHHTGDADLRHQTYQVDIVASDPGTAESIFETLRTGFHAFRGNMGSQFIRHTNVNEAPDEVSEPEDATETRLSTARVELEFYYT